MALLKAPSGAYTEAGLRDVGFEGFVAVAESAATRT